VADRRKGIDFARVRRSSKPDQIFVDCSTISPESSKKVSDMAERKGCTFLGAPVSGGNNARLFVRRSVDGLPVTSADLARHDYAKSSNAVAETYQRTNTSVRVY